MANLKLATGGVEHRSRAREELATRIAELGAAEQRVVESERRISELWTASSTAQETLDAALVAVDKVHEERLAGAPEATMPALLTKHKEARERVAQAEGALGTFRSARKAEEHQRAELRDAAAIRRLNLQEAVVRAAASDLAVRHLCESFSERFREFADARRAVEFLHRKGALPSDLKDILREKPWPELPGAAPWQAALAQLEKDADAPFPSI